MKRFNIIDDTAKAIKVINGCKTIAQLKVAKNFLSLFSDRYRQLEFGRFKYHLINIWGKKYWSIVLPNEAA